MASNDPDAPAGGQTAAVASTGAAVCEVFLDEHLGRWMVSFNGHALESHRDRNAALKAARRVARLHSKATGESAVVGFRDDGGDADVGKTSLS